MAYFISHTVGPTNTHPSQTSHFFQNFPGNSDPNGRIVVNKLQGNNEDETVTYTACRGPLRLDNQRAPM
jgi:hypothetical protein